MTAAQSRFSQSLHHVTWTAGDPAEEPEPADAAPLEPFLESPSELLRADVVMEDGAVVVRVRGEIDASTVSLLEMALRAASSDGPATVVIDMAELIFIDSMGLNCLMRYRRDHQCQLLLRAPNDHIRRVFVVAGLDKVFLTM